MALPGTLRHAVAVALACATFLALFFGAQLMWWLALALGAAVYAAALLLIRERKPATDVMVAPRVSLADLRGAENTIAQAAREIDSLVPQLPHRSQPALGAMAEDLRTLARQVGADPEDYLRTRRFVSHFLPHILTNTQSYAALADKAGADARLTTIGARIEAYAPAVHRINLACLENDFEALSSEVSALDQQLSHRSL